MRDDCVVSWFTTVVFIVMYVLRYLALRKERLQVVVSQGCHYLKDESFMERLQLESTIILNRVQYVWIWTTFQFTSGHI